MRRKKRMGAATTTIHGEKGYSHFRDEPTKDRADTVNEVLGVLLTATAAPEEAARALEEIVRESGWWDAYTAKALLSTIEDLLRSGKDMSSTMKAAVDRAVREAAKISELAKHFANEHPLMVGIVCAIVALGVLYIFWPEILELLGFGLDGPIEGTKAMTTFTTSYSRFRRKLRGLLAESVPGCTLRISVCIPAETWDDSFSLRADSLLRQHFSFSYQTLRTWSSCDEARTYMHGLESNIS